MLFWCLQNTHYFLFIWHGNLLPFAYKPQICKTKIITFNTPYFKENIVIVSSQTNNIFSPSAENSHAKLLNHRTNDITKLPKTELKKTPPKTLLVGGWTNPSEKYAHLKNMLVKLEIFPQIGMNIKNIWNHPQNRTLVFLTFFISPDIAMSARGLRLQNAGWKVGWSPANTSTLTFREQEKVQTFAGGGNHYG